MLIFVYGTLKRDGSNHHYLEGQRFVGRAVTKPLYRLYDLGGYPGMVADPELGSPIEGEVWDVDRGCLQRLDELEDVDGGEYAREVIPLEAPFSGDEIQGYRYLRSVAGCRDLGASW